MKLGSFSRLHVKEHTIKIVALEKAIQEEEITAMIFCD